MELVETSVAYVTINAMLVTMELVETPVAHVMAHATLVTIAKSSIQYP